MKERPVPRRIIGGFDLQKGQVTRCGGQLFANGFCRHDTRANPHLQSRIDLQRAQEGDSFCQPGLGSTHQVLPAPSAANESGFGRFDGSTSNSLSIEASRSSEIPAMIAFSARRRAIRMQTWFLIGNDVAELMTVLWQAASAARCSNQIWLAGQVPYC